MKEVHCTRGMTALVDDADFALVSAYSWQAAPDGKTFYAQTVVNRTTLRMHRLITAADPSVHIDHRNRNGLDNQRHNLRVATHSQNQHNRSAQNRPFVKHSRFKGLTWCAGRWQVRIAVDGRRRLIGYFTDENEAARARTIALHVSCAGILLF